MSQRKESDDADHCRRDSPATSDKGAQPQPRPQFQPQTQPHCSQPSASDCSGGDESTRRGDNGPHQSTNQQATASATATEDRSARAPALDSIAASDSPSVLDDDDPRNGRTPVVASLAAAVSPFSRLATVELQLIMRCCDQSTLIALARCSRFSFAGASHPFVWQPLSPISLKCDWPLELSSRLSKSLLRHTDISVTWRLRSKEAVSVEQVTALAALPRLSGVSLETAFDPSVNGHTRLSDEGAVLLFRFLSERIDHGGTLASLSFSGNKIGRAGGVALAALIERSRTLTKLEIPSLRSSLVASGALASLVAALARSRTLTCLDIGSDNLDLAAMATVVRHSPSLTTLILFRLRCDAESVAVFAAAVAQSRSLTDLKLPDCGISAAGAEALAAAIKQSGCIRSIDLSHNSFGAAGAAALVRLLVSDRCALTSLNLSGSHIGHKGALALVEALQTNRTLTELRLCSIGCGGEGIRTLLAALRHNPHCCLRVLDLSSNPLSASCAGSLGEEIGSSLTLERLDLRSCRFGDEGMAALAAGIGRSRSLQRLDVFSNTFGAPGATALAAAVATCPTLTSLIVNDNEIGDEGLSGLAPVLVNVRRLQLPRCRLTLLSAALLAELIQRSRVLSSLEISSDRPEARSVALIADALQPSSSLRILKLNFAYGVDAAALAAALSRGWKASELRLNYCGLIGDGGVSALAAALEQLGSRCTLTALSLMNCGLAAAGALALVRAATHTPRLRSLDLRYNDDITAAARPALIAACGPQPHFELELSPLQNVVV